MEGFRIDLNEEDSSPGDVRCILCNMADENETTGALSSKEDVSAHQNCLIFSSGIFCRSSPSFDDLFGFDVDDVKKEYHRGRKLRCHRCGKRGATAGCEMRRCQRSYHYPCAIEDKARPVEKTKEGYFTLYCEKHDPKRPKNPEKLQVSANESLCSVSTSNGTKRPRLDDSHAGTSSGSDSGTSIRMMGRKRKFEPILIDSGESDPELTCAPIEIDQEEITPPKQHQQSTPVPEDKRNNEEPRADTTGVDCPSEDGDETDLEADAESPSLLRSEYLQENVPFNVIIDSGPSVESEISFGPCSPSPGPAPAAPAAAAPAALAAPAAAADADAVCNTDGSLSSPEDAAPPHIFTTTAIIHPPVPSCPPLDSPPLGVVAAAESAGSPDRSNPKAPSCAEPEEEIARPASRNTATPDMSHGPPGGPCTPNQPECPLDLTSPTREPTASPQPHECREEGSVSETSAALFWRRCNEVGCTEAIFADLTRQISSLAEKVQAQHATQQDYTVSLRILEASGKLPAIFRQLEQEFEEREKELQRKKEALRDARAVLSHLS